MVSDDHDVERSILSNSACSNDVTGYQLLLLECVAINIVRVVVVNASMSPILTPSNNKATVENVIIPDDAVIAIMLFIELTSESMSVFLLYL